MGLETAFGKQVSAQPALPQRRRVFRLSGVPTGFEGGGVHGGGGRREEGTQALNDFGAREGASPALLPATSTPRQGLPGL